MGSSSSLLWLWILLGILALCCLLALCGGGLAACMGGKKKKKKSKRATRVSEPAPVPAVLPIYEEQQELLPMVPPLLEPSAMMQPTMMETTVPMMQTAAPTAFSAMPAMQIGAPAVSAMPMMGNAMAAQAFPATAMQGIGGFGTQAW